MPRIPIEDRTHRLVPTGHPPIQTFEDVSTPEDLHAVLELEGWTNDRLVVHRLRRLSPERWVYGCPNASVVMAAFLHASPQGARFNGPDLDAWYCALRVTTAIAEVAHHLRREAANVGWSEMRGQYRCYEASLQGAYEDIRRPDAADLPQTLVAAFHDPADWSRSQTYGEDLRAAGGDGIVYDSLRHRGGVDVVAYDPRNVTDVTIGASYDLLVPVEGKVIARRLS